MAAPGNFDISTQHSDGALVVSPRGEIDMATIGLLKDAIAAERAQGDDLVIDLRGVSFMDSSGLRYVLELNRLAEQEGFALRVVRGPVAVQRVFEVSGIQSLLAFVDEPSESRSGEA
jgi:anti-sigma B factor antagonist